jgi:pantoate--beta-alanine ligase
MDTVQTIEALRARLRGYRRADRSIGFVPTMGALHEGHLSLMRQAVGANDLTVASVFVNPTQFGPGEDFEAYPRRLQDDRAQMAEAGVDVLFAPDEGEMYPPGSELKLYLPELSSMLEGVARPTHFHGVTLVVAKLLNIVQPTRLYLGQKDYQQSVIVRRMMQELFFESELYVGPTVREADGLALSSRNTYLTAEQRRQAPLLYQCLRSVREHAQQFQRPEAAQQWVYEQFKQAPAFQLDYFELRNARDLSPVDALRPAQEPVALIAAYMGKTRLLDNMFLFDPPQATR